MSPENICRVGLAVFLTLGIPTVPVSAAGTPYPAKQAQRAGGDQPRVWTNKDIDALHNQNLISLVGPEPTQATPSSSASDVTMFDTCRYIEQEAQLQLDLNARETQLQQQAAALAEATSLGETTGGVNLNQGNEGITPDQGIEILESQIQEVKNEMDAVTDAARRDSIPLNALYGFNVGAEPDAAACAEITP